MADPNRRPEAPRPLHPSERTALLAVLEAAEFDGRDALVAQVDSAHVVARCPCGCATVDLAVDPEAPAAPSEVSIVPNGAAVLGEGGDEIGGVLVLLDDGRLATLEIYSYGDPIAAFPPADRLRPAAPQ
jgi:hypothetical protein